MELRSEIDVSAIVSGAALQAELAANTILEAKSMFSFTFSAAVQTENIEAMTSAVSTQMSARTGKCIICIFSIIAIIIVNLHDGKTKLKETQNVCAMGIIYHVTDCQADLRLATSSLGSHYYEGAEVQ